MEENTSLIKESREFIDQQRKDFTSSISIFRDLLSISLKHPFLSIFIILTFQLSVNTLDNLINVYLIDTVIDYKLANKYVFILIIEALVCFFATLYLRLKLQRSYNDLALNERKVLITLASPNKEVSKTAAHTFFRALLLDAKNSPKKNSLELVVILTSEKVEVKQTANLLKSQFESEDRDVIIADIKINNMSVEQIKAQINKHFDDIKSKGYSPNEVIADYTGGTKEMSVALYLASIDNTIFPAYICTPQK